MTGSPVLCSNLRNRRNPSNSNYHMSINNCQVIQKSCSDHRFTLGTLVSLGRLPVTVFKLLNDRQSEFRESSEAIISICELRSFKRSQKKKFSIISIRICRIAVRSWHQSRDILPIRRDACSWPEIFSTRECGLF